MKITGTVVDKNMNLTGLVLKGRPSEFNMSGSQNWIISPFNIKDAKKFIQNNGCSDFELNSVGNIVGKNNKKLSDLPMYDKNGNIVNNKIRIKSAIEEDGKLIGAVIFFEATNEEKKIKLADLNYIYSYCEPVNFMLRVRDDTSYITGKGDTKKEDIPVTQVKAKNNGTIEIVANIPNFSYAYDSAVYYMVPWSFAICLKNIPVKVFKEVAKNFDYTTNDEDIDEELIKYNIPITNKIKNSPSFELLCFGGENDTFKKIFFEYGYFNDKKEYYKTGQEHELVFTYMLKQIKALSKKYNIAMVKSDIFISADAYDLIDGTLSADDWEKMGLDLNDMESQGNFLFRTMYYALKALFDKYEIPLNETESIKMTHEYEKNKKEPLFEYHKPGYVYTNRKDKTSRTYFELGYFTIKCE